MAHHEGGPAHPLNNIGHAESFTGARDPQQRLVGIAGLQRLDQFLKGLFLITLGAVVADQLKGHGALLEHRHGIANSGTPALESPASVQAKRGATVLGSKTRRPPYLALSVE